MKKVSLGIIVIFFITLITPTFASKSTEVQISAPLRPKYVAKGFKNLYISDFIITGTHDIDKNVNININKEIKKH